MPASTFHLRSDEEALALLRARAEHAWWRSLKQRSIPFLIFIFIGGNFVLAFGHGAKFVAETFRDQKAEERRLLDESVRRAADNFEKQLEKKGIKPVRKPIPNLQSKGRVVLVGGEPKK